ncbi:alpha/beta hydrolase [Paenibacillus sp. N3/727]|uniref:alpha/beta fold hydrolase n=1 Tax=Paenibacillus sp. N3/727 TaxID=2925845 RepID=UPI001F532652|nr:alpha/beta hydrolase [Paenibacillus sp. N3/727]UNK17223.1 alpha/beta hydrolase [Paenibacillus sp. N3/727]
MNDKSSLFKTEDGKAAFLNSYNQLLAKCSVPYEELNMNTRYGKTYIVACGDKSLPPLILLHGSGSNSSMWIGDIANYSKNYRVFAVDIPGDPGKSEEKQYSLKSSAYSEWMDDVLRSLQLQKASFIGISLGAWMIINFAVKHPAKVDKIVLISPSGIGPQKISFMLKAIPLMLLGEKGRDMVTRLVNGNQSIPEEALKNQKLISRHYKFRTESVPIFTDSELSRLTMPVMLIAGEKDVMLHSKKSVERLSRLLPDANVNLLPDYGHVLINLTHSILPFLLAD